MTDVDLRDHLEARISWLEAKVDLLHQHAAEAVTLARSLADKRSDAENHVREQLRAQAGTFLARETFDVQHAAMHQRLESLEKQAANLQGRIAATVAVVGAVFAILQLGLHFLNGR